jgi:hypothetical protein
MPNDYFLEEANWELLKDEVISDYPSDIVLEALSNQALLIEIDLLSPTPYNRLKLPNTVDSDKIRIGVIYREFTINNRIVPLENKPLYVGSNLFVFNDLGEYNFRFKILNPIGSYHYQVRGFILPLSFGNTDISYSSLLDRPNLSLVALSGSYSDLIDKPVNESMIDILEVWLSN